MIVALLVLATTSTCPRLPPAASAPQNALDIRPDQVKVVAAVRVVCLALYMILSISITCYITFFRCLYW